MAGNQEGAVDIKKIRTWRQYMNRCVIRFYQSYLADGIIALDAEVSTGLTPLCSCTFFSNYYLCRPLDKIK